MSLSKIRRLAFSVALLAMPCAFVPSTPIHAQSASVIRYQAETLISEGESDIRSGEWLINQKPSTLAPDRDLTKSKAEGKRLVERGKEKIARGKAMLEELEARQAEATLAQQAAENLIPSEYYLSVPRIEWSEQIDKESADILKALYAKGIRKRGSIAFDGVYLYDQFLYRKLEAPTQAIGNLLKRIDGSQFSVVTDLNYQVHADEDSTTLAPIEDDSTAEAVSAIVYVEVIYHRSYKDALISFRAVKPSDWSLLYSHTQIVKVTDSFISATGVTVPNENAAELPETFSFGDQNGFVYRASNIPNLVFDIVYEGVPLSFLSRAIPTLYKDVLVGQSSLTVIDSDFIGKALPYSSDESRVHFKASNNSVLKISTGDEESFTLEAINLQNNQSVTLGEIAMDVEIPEPAPEEETPEVTKK